jgi:hypothetical protein
VICFVPTSSGAPIAPPIVHTAQHGNGFIVNWTLPSTVEADAIHVEVLVDGVIVDEISLPGNATHLVDETRVGDMIYYLVRYEDDGDLSPPGGAPAGTYPYCTQIINLSLEYPYVEIREACIFPLPIGP